MKALVEVGMVLHTGVIIRAYVPIRIDDLSDGPKIDGLYQHMMKSNIIVDLTNKKYIKHRTLYPLSDASDEIVALFMSVAPTDVAELRAKESRWTS